MLAGGVSIRRRQCRRTEHGQFLRPTSRMACACHEPGASLIVPLYFDALWSYSIPTARFRPTSQVLPVLLVRSRDRLPAPGPDDHAITSFLLIDISHRFRKLATAKRRAQCSRYLYLPRGNSHMTREAPLLATTCHWIPADQNSNLNIAPELVFTSLYRLWSWHTARSRRYELPLPHQDGLFTSPHGLGTISHQDTVRGCRGGRS
ncbi:hypothetical protein GE09DRAFT_169880 [Coniochaeta sp. 2T2.1]|nr:hypothetical protein GE09DRAFT_169880 [Coniochaeta sp. 2T2.1]